MEMEMEMEMEMDTVTFYQHLELNPPPSSGQALSYYYPPLAGDIVPAAAHVRSERPTPEGASARVARKDRHSKICTAGGMRDRRMRLSLDVARRFFALQDKLGFDKASKTVQWLLDMSTPGINGLTSAMSMSMSEDGSVLLDNDQIMMADSAVRNKQRSSKARSKLQPPPPRKSNAAAAAVRDKESRARARERARERTRERNRLRSLPAPASLLHAGVPLPAGSGSSSFEHGSYYEQEPWELSGVVFAKARFQY